MDKEILVITDLISNESLRLPTNPGHEVNGLDLKLCTYFNSFTLPLKLVFKNIEAGAPNHYLMYKVGPYLSERGRKGDRIQRFLFFWSLLVISRLSQLVEVDFANPSFI